MGTLGIVIQKTIAVQTHGDYPTYATPDNKMIAEMLQLPKDKNKLLSEKDIQTVQTPTAEYEIDNLTDYDVLDQIQTCIPMSNSISPRGMAEGHFMPSTPDG